MPCLVPKGPPLTGVPHSDVQESQEDPNGLIISVQLLIRALELKRSDTDSRLKQFAETYHVSEPCAMEELLQRLDAVAAVSARVSLQAELRNSAPATPGLAALREAVSLAWSSLDAYSSRNHPRMVACPGPGKSVSDWVCLSL